MKRLPRDRQKKLADDAWLLREWKTWHQEELDAALAGPNGVLIAALVALLDRLELNAAATLLEFMQRHDWTSVSYAERLTVLHQIGQAIMRLRERNGLAPLDDPIPFLDQPDTAFRRIKQILLCAAPPGAHPGSNQMQQTN
jgi:hypothetical protein